MGHGSHAMLPGGRGSSVPRSRPSSTSSLPAVSESSSLVDAAQPVTLGLSATYLVNTVPNPMPSAEAASPVADTTPLPKPRLCRPTSLAETNQFNALDAAMATLAAKAAAPSRTARVSVPPLGIILCSFPSFSLPTDKNTLCVTRRHTPRRH